VIYLDHAATTPLAPEAWEAMRPWLEPGGIHANPASDHALGRQASAAVEAARAQVAALIGARADEIIFTSGATEANNLAIKGAVDFHAAAEQGAHVVSTRIEHKAVLDPVRWLATRGARLTLIEPDRQGRISATDVIAALRPETVLVSVMWVNNETGVINPIAEIAAACAERGVLLHVDAAQAAGRLRMNLAELPISLLSLSAHKLYGPKGIGALFVRRRPRARVSPQLHGGGHEQGMRSGTLPTHQIAGFGAAAALAASRIEADWQHARMLAEKLRAGLRTLPGCLANGEPDATVPHIVNLSIQGVHGEALRADLHELAVSSGSACSAATREASYVLRAMGRSDLEAGAALRISTGRGTTPEEIELAAERILAAATRLRALAPDRRQAA
jgi:cysteine desulfurase